MQFQPAKGTRDFYPDAMRLRNWIVDAWRRVSIRNGFEEYDAPIFEYLDLFTAKSGQEIAQQLFHFTDRGGRSLAIRPEITPSLARMVNAKINSLPRPIKWFSVPRLCRAENPQRGRLREFFQWNIDVIGSDDILADAECVFVAVDFLREVGLGPNDVCVRIGSRPLLLGAFNLLEIPEEKHDTVLAVLDKRMKVTQTDFQAMCRQAGLNGAQITILDELQSIEDTANLLDFVDALCYRRGLKQLPLQEVAGSLTAKGAPELLHHDLLADQTIKEQVMKRWPIFTSAAARLNELNNALLFFGAVDYCRLDLRIVRGLAYYTGIVYEIFDAAGSLRAVAGGGRYDNLLEVLGGPKVGATGFGMGDVVLGILLEEKGKVPESVRATSLDFFVIDDGEDTFDQVIAAVGALRHSGLGTDFSYKRQPLGKQLKEANRRGAKAAVIVRPGGVTVKDLATGLQTVLNMEDFLARAGEVLAGPPA